MVERFGNRGQAACYDHNGCPSNRVVFFHAHLATNLCSEISEIRSAIFRMCLLFEDVLCFDLCHQKKPRRRFFKNSDRISANNIAVLPFARIFLFLACHFSLVSSLDRYFNQQDIELRLNIVHFSYCCEFMEIEIKYY